MSRLVLVLVLNGPNLNMLGTREPVTYGHETFADVETLCQRSAAEQGLEVEFRQTNHEGQLIDWIHQARGRCAGILINPGAWTHTSVAIRDALVADEQALIREAAQEAQSFQRQVTEESQSKALETLKGSMQFNEIAPEEIGRFRAKVKPVVDEFAKDLDPTMVKVMYDAIEKVRAGQ